MFSHTHHPMIREHGLQDNCLRCDEMAKAPFLTLDTDNLYDLYVRTQAWMRDDGDTVPRSDNEATAMRLMEAHVVNARTLARALDPYEEARRDKLAADAREASVADASEPTDDDIYNRSTGPHTGVEGGIAYDTSADEPGSLGENDWRL